MKKMTRYTVPSNLEIMLGIAQVKTEPVDVYRDRDDNGPRPYRAKINGALMRNAAGEVRKFRTMDEAIKAIGGDRERLGL